MRASALSFPAQGAGSNEALPMRTGTLLVGGQAALSCQGCCRWRCKASWPDKGVSKPAAPWLY